MPRLRQSVHLALETLRINPLRTALSTLGIVMGSASLAAVLALGDGAERLARQRIEREGLNVVQLRPRTDDLVDGLRVPVRGYPLFDERDARSLAAALGPGESVLLRMEGTGWIESPQTARPRAARVEARLLLNGSRDSRAIGAGRALTPADETAAGHPVVISHRLAADLHGKAQSAVGATLRVGGRARQIVGVLAPFDGERAYALEVPFSAGEGAMVSVAEPRPRILLVQTARVEDVPALKGRVERWVAARSWNGRVRLEASGPQRLKEVA